MKLPRIWIVMRAVAACLVLAGGLSRADAQMSLDSTTGVLPTDDIRESHLLGDALTSLQAQWATPLNATQAEWIGSINSLASGAVSGQVPATFSQASSDARIAEAAGLRYAMNGQMSDLHKVRDALLVADIPPLNSNDFIIQPEVLTGYLSAYDFIRGAPDAALSVSERAAIESRLLSLTSSLSNGNLTYSNARAKVGGTRALGGVILQNQGLIDQGLTDLQGHFDYSTTDDGLFTDSQAHYLNYTLRHLALFTRAYDQASGVDLYDDFQPYFDMSLGIQLPNGQIPNISNGLNLPLHMHLFSRTSDATDAANMMWYLEGNVAELDKTNTFNNNYSDVGHFVLTDFSVAARAPATSPTFFSPGQAQVSVFRQDWGPNSDYLMMSPGIDSPAVEFEVPEYGNLIFPAFHSHGDTSEILLASRGQYLLVASGYDRDDLTNSPPGFQSQGSNQHNVILVDGELGVTNEGRAMRPEDFMSTHRLDSREHGDFRGVSDFSTLRTSYGGANLSRSIAFAGEDYFVVSDVIGSDATHEYGFNLIGRGTQTVLTDTDGLKQVKWEYNGAQVIEHIISTHDMTLTTEQTWMHDQFDEFEMTQRMTAIVNAEDAQFLSILETGEAGSASRLTLTNLSTGTDMLALLVDHATEGWTDTILSQSSSQLRSVNALVSDALYAYMRQEEGQTTGAMFAEGTQLSVDGELLLEASDALTMSLALESQLLLATISDDGLVAGTELRIFGLGQLVEATLEGQSLVFTNSGEYASVFLPHGGSLKLVAIPVPEPSTLVLAATGVGATWIATQRRRRRRAR